MTDKRSLMTGFAGRLAILGLTALLLGACGSNDKADRKSVV